MNAEEKQKILKEALVKLGEHFDYIQVFVGVREQGETYCASTGNGEWYARYGACREWIIQEEEQMRCGIRKDRGT